VFGFDRAAPDVNARAVNFRDVQRIECDARADDVADGIDRADFVEVDFVNGHVVRLRFGCGEEHGERVGLALLEISPDWTIFSMTPPFPEFISGHSSFSAAGAEILRLFTGSDRSSRDGMAAFISRPAILPDGR
jgi:hypothetical protein